MQPFHERGLRRLATQILLSALYAAERGDRVEQAWLNSDQAVPWLKILNFDPLMARRRALQWLKMSPQERDQHIARHQE